MGDPATVCCLLGVCCPPAEQRAAWIQLLTGAGLSEKDAGAGTDAILATLGPTFERIKKFVEFFRS